MNITFVKSDGVKETIKSRSKDDDDIISATLEFTLHFYKKLYNDK